LEEASSRVVTGERISGAGVDHNSLDSLGLR
jgi:hypothetical protein